MLKFLQDKVRDMSVMRRLGFAVSFWPSDMPGYYQHVTNFSIANKPSRNSLTTDQVRVLIENLEVVDKEAFSTDEDLGKEIVDMHHHGGNGPLGIVLISSKQNCNLCGSKLYTRADRSSSITVYTNTSGPIPATHYTKYCRKQGCSFQQHYGFSTMQSSMEVSYDSDWLYLPYFLSSRETAFAIDMLRHLDFEILIGQISYKQRADIYNECHRYVHVHAYLVVYVCACTIIIIIH